MQTSQSCRKNRGLLFMQTFRGLLRNGISRSNSISYAVTIQNPQCVSHPSSSIMHYVLFNHMLLRITVVTRYTTTTALSLLNLHLLLLLLFYDIWRMVHQHQATYSLQYHALTRICLHLAFLLLLLLLVLGPEHDFFLAAPKRSKLWFNC